MAISAQVFDEFGGLCVVLMGNERGRAFRIEQAPRFSGNDKKPRWFLANQAVHPVYRWHLSRRQQESRERAEARLIAIAERQVVRALNAVA